MLFSHSFPLQSSKYTTNDAVNRMLSYQRKEEKFFKIEKFIYIRWCLDDSTLFTLYALLLYYFISYYFILIYLLYYSLFIISSMGIPIKQVIEGSTRHKVRSRKRVRISEGEDYHELRRRNARRWQRSGIEDVEFRENLLNLERRADDIRRSLDENISRNENNNGPIIVSANGVTLADFNTSNIGVAAVENETNETTRTNSIANTPNTILNEHSNHEDFLNDSGNEEDLDSQRLNYDERRREQFNRVRILRSNALSHNIRERHRRAQNTFANNEPTPFAEPWERRVRRRIEPELFTDNNDDNRESFVIGQDGGSIELWTLRNEEL